MVQHKERVPVAVVVVKSRLLDVAKSLETTPEENLLMARETIAYLHDNGLEVIVDLEHALDAFCGRRENGEACEADFAKRSLEYFHQMVAQCVEQKVSRTILCDTTGGASPEEVAQLFAGLRARSSQGKFWLSWAHRPRTWSRQHAGRGSWLERRRCRARFWGRANAAAM